MKAFNIWGIAISSEMGKVDYKAFLKDGKKVTLEEAIFRSSQVFKPSNLREYLHFWEHEILKDHPNKVNILKWLSGVRIEDFLQSFTEGIFQGIPMHSYYPEFANLRTMSPKILRHLLMTQCRTGNLEEC